MSWKSDVRVVVGIDFGTTYSWGRPAFIKGTTNEADDTNEPKSVGLFKLHLGSLGKLQDHLKPKIPVEFKKAIIDYLREMGKLIKKTVESVEGIKFHENVLLVLSVPAEYSKKELAIMRECASEADLIKEENSEYLQFTTEPEAAAIYCMKNCLESYEIGTTFMIVDCGGGTVDLTTRKLVGENQLVFKPFRKGDPPERKTSNGFIQRFHRIAKRDDIVDIDSEIRIYNLCPVSGFQTFATFYIYITKEYDPKYCDGMEVLGTLKIDLSNNGTDRRVSFALSFGQMELLTATARNETDGQNYLATFEINKEIGIV
ncbi:unnamed protein product [Rhizophagus irregularis]|nr:unnamed protein product [Rhizophagus irregularis]